MDTREKEIWKDVSGFGGLYQVSSHGNMRSLDRIKRGKGGVWYNKKGSFMKPVKSDNGYLIITLIGIGIKKTFLVSRLVAIEFVENPLNLQLVGHDDDDKWDNYYKNLYWTDKSENHLHNGASKENVKNRLESVHRRGGLKTPVVAVIDGQIVAEYESMSQAGKEGFCVNQISLCCQGKRKTCKGFRWYYKDDWERG